MLVWKHVRITCDYLGVFLFRSTYALFESKSMVKKCTASVPMMGNCEKMMAILLVPASVLTTGGCWKCRQLDLFDAVQMMLEAP